MAGRQTFLRWPDFPGAATLERGRLGHGWGRDFAGSRRRAVGEVVEIASCAAWGDERIVEASYLEVSDRAWHPSELTGFSDAQRANRRDWNDRLDGLDWIPPGLPSARPIGWMEARDPLSGRTILVPADAVLIGRREAGEESACVVADTNGCAAGVDRDSALLAALYELIERDATGRWWYGLRPRAQIDPLRLEGGSEIRRSLERRGRILRLVDITTDIGIPTVAAIAADGQGRAVALGFAACGRLDAAAQAALGELLQTELAIHVEMEHRGTNPRLGDWLRAVDLRGSPLLGADARWASARTGGGDAADLPACLSALERRGCRVAILDLTRSAFDVPVFRAVSPDLCHWKPRFGRRRLLALDENDIPPEHSGRSGVNGVYLMI